MLEFNKIKNIYLITTHKCNLKCKYCFVHQDMIDMPLNIAFDAIDFLVQHNGEENLHHTIQFFGGEPLLRWNDLIVPTVLYSKSKYPERNFSFSISSNCTLLTKDKINFLKEHKINILTSMDGNKSTQDFNRPFHNGKGSHEIVEKNIKYLLQEGYSPLFRATVIPETCNNLFNDYLYAQSLGYKKLFFITDGYTTWTKESLLILEEELNKIVTHYIQYFKINNKPFIHLTCIEKFFSKIYNDIQNIKHNLPIKNYTPELKCGYG